MTTDENKEDTCQVMEVFQSEPRENYNKVVFRKPFTIAIPVCEGNNGRSEDMGMAETSFPDLAQWRTRQEAERERIRKLDHTPQPPQRPPKKPHLRPVAHNGEVRVAKMITAWKSNSELESQSSHIGLQSQMATKVKQQTELPNGLKIMSKTHSGLPDDFCPDTYSSLNIDMADIESAGQADSNIVISSMSSQNDANLVISSSSGNVAAKRNLFAPKPFILNNGNNSLSGEKQAIPTSKTFPSLNKFLSLDEKNSGIPGGSSVKPRTLTGSKPILAPKPFIKAIALKQTQLETQKGFVPFQPRNGAAGRFLQHKISPDSTAFSSQSTELRRLSETIKIPSPMASLPTKIPTTSEQLEKKREINKCNGNMWKSEEAKCEIEFSQQCGAIEDLLHGQPGTSSGKMFQDKRSTIYYPASSVNCDTYCDSIANLQNTSVSYPSSEIKSPSQMSSTELRDLMREKEQLLRRLSVKLSVMKEEKLALKEEVKQNEEIGEKLIQKISAVAQMAEVDKLSLHITEMDKMTSLLVGLSGRLARTESEMETLAMGADTDEKKSLQRKREKLIDQLTEAKKLKCLKDKMADKVIIMLGKYLTAGEMEEYIKFVEAKARLIMEVREVEDKIKLGEDQMDKLQGCSDHISPIVPVTSL